MKNNSKKKSGKAQSRPPVLRPVRFTPKTADFSCDTQFEADMLNYIIKNETYGEVYKPGTYWWVNDEERYILEDDIDN